MIILGYIISILGLIFLIIISSALLMHFTEVVSNSKDRRNAKIFQEKFANILCKLKDEFDGDDKIEKTVYYTLEELERNIILYENSYWNIKFSKNSVLERLNKYENKKDSF